MKIISDWFQRLFNDPQAIILTIMLALGISVVLIMGRDLAPVLASMVMAYLLEGVVQLLQRWRLPRVLAVIIVFTLFLAFVLFAVSAVWAAAAGFAATDATGATIAEHDRERPKSAAQPARALPGIYYRRADSRSDHRHQGRDRDLGPKTIIVYLVLAPLLVFFFLKDKELILNWLHGFLPRDHTLGQQVWREVDRQMGNYVRGKFLEIVVVWVATFVAFAAMNLQFAMLLALMVGLSVIVPYIGAVVVTVPVALVAFFQWGWSSEFLWLMGVYLIVQGLDGNLLVPLLFSEVVDLHPIAIIVAVLVFSGLWGFWGVFFAIPLATVVQSILKAWPRPALVADP